MNLIKASWKLLLLFLFPCEHLLFWFELILLFPVMSVLFGLMIRFAGYFLDTAELFSSHFPPVLNDGEIEDNLEDEHEDSELCSCSTPESLSLLCVDSTSVCEEYLAEEGVLGESVFEEYLAEEGVLGVSVCEEYLAEEGVLGVSVCEEYLAGVLGVLLLKTNSLMAWMFASLLFVMSGRV